MRRCQFCGELVLSRLRPLSVNELEEIKADADSIDTDQIRNMLDVVDVVIERAFFGSRAHENGIDADHSVTCPNHLDLFVTNVALDVVIATDVGVGHNRRLCCERENFLKPGWVYVSKFDNHAERLTFAHYIAAKRGQTLRWRAACREDSAVACCIASGVGESN
mgnify:CR=1 FL=1